VFDALPFPAFITDEDMRLLAANPAAKKMIGTDASFVLRQRNGEVLRCIHSTETGEGCGRSTSCSDCVMRKAVRFTYVGREPVRMRDRMEFQRDGQVQAMHVLVTASPVVYRDQSCALLFIEDLTLLCAIGDILPICMSCKRVRDEQLWTQVEAYLSSHLDLKFTHGICPDCAKRLYPDFSQP
jgi:PAS domain-containing protein